MSAGDGVIPVYEYSFSEYWIDELIADLQEAKRYIAELKRKEK